MYDIQSIYTATSIADAIQALTARPDAIVICGGSDVLVQIREGKLAGRPLVSIYGIAELSGICMEEDGTILIRPGTTFAQVTQSPIVQQHIPTLGYATDQAGGPQLRNMGTIGGNVCNGVTSADSAPALLTLNAQLEITGPGGTRRQSLQSFYQGPGRVNLAHDELLTAIRIAKPDYENFGGNYIKFAQRNAMDIATLGCAVHVKLNPAKTAIEEVRLAFGVAAPNPVRCPGAEAAVTGMPLTQSTLAALGRAALDEVNPRTSWRASKELRVQLVQELSARALQQAIENAGGTIQ